MLSVVRSRSTVFTPSLMRRISRWVTGVPLPGWIFSAVMHEIELAVLLDDIAFAHRAGDNRNHGKPLKIGWRIWRGL